MGVIALIFFVETFWKQILIAIISAVAIEFIFPFFFKALFKSLGFVFLPVIVVLGKGTDLLIQWGIISPSVNNEFTVRFIVVLASILTLISTFFLSIVKEDEWNYELSTGMSINNAIGVNEKRLLLQGRIPPERPGVTKEYIEQLANSMGLTIKNNKVEPVSMYALSIQEKLLPSGETKLRKTGIGFDYPDKTFVK
ncbi:hypothetical protein [Thermoanaerobacterium butyriciformans]|uniref:Uncharacterized protein n=1 Tax=Thermoanaerobacterium butyriciformans TaxID=1702242 RepID=A0ABS4NB30_9THEO|nr:hypothetical protein [Thermoanaerobacterium butyriciformans]MBP2070856.1 hypothetical protein [Thermoanaerobacterium butyriciformans]